MAASGGGSGGAAAVAASAASGFGGGAAAGVARAAAAASVTASGSTAPTTTIPGRAMVEVSAVSGITVTVHHPILDREAIAFQLPQNNEALFVGRRDILRDLSDRLTGSTHQISLTACHGLGGIGKTQIAIRYLYSQTRYHHKIWFNAESLASLESQYIDLALQLRLIVHSDLKTTPKDRIIEMVKVFLQRLSEPLLVVYDNATNYADLERFMPSHGDILITTRQLDWPGPVRLEIDVMSPEDAKALVIKILKTEIAEVDIVRLTETLGRLPLALTQACAYIQQTGVKIEDYLTLYEALKKRMLDDGKLLPGHPHENVWITFTLSMDKIMALNPRSVELLHYAGFLAPDAIPRSLLTYTFASKKILTEADYEDFKETILSEEDSEIFNDAIKILRNYSLFNFDFSNNTVLMHRVLQDVIQTLKANPDEQILLVIPLLKSIVWDYVRSQTVERKNVSHIRQLIPHFEKLDKLARTDLIYSRLTSNRISYECLALLFINYASCISTLEGNARHQINLLEQAQSIIKELHGTKNGTMASLLNDLANAYGDIDDIARKKELLEEALEVSQSYYKEENICTAIILSGLGTIYAILEDATHSIERLNQALTIMQNHYSEEQGLIAQILAGIAHAYGLDGDHKHKKELLVKALTLSESYYGKEHIETTHILSKLAIAHGDLGHMRDKKNTLERVLAIERGFYGKGHITLAETLGSLAVVYRDLDDSRHSKILLEEALPIVENHYGKEHFKTAKFLAALATACSDLGDILRSEKLFKQALKIQTDHYKNDSIEIATLEYNLALIRAMLGKFASALKLINRCEPIFRAHAEAESYLKQCLETKTMIQADFLITRSSLNPSSTPYVKAIRFAAAGKLAEADTAFQEAITAEAQVGVMTDYANFLIQRMTAPDRAVPYLLQIREDKRDMPVQFVSHERDCLDDALKTWLDGHKEIKVSSWVMATWLLLNIHTNKSEMSEAKTLMTEWILKHTKIAEPLCDSSWYLLGHAALLTENPKLAWSCFACVETLPDDTKAIFLSLEAQKDEDLSAEADLMERRELLRVKVSTMSADEAPVYATPIRAAMGGAGAREEEHDDAAAIYSSLTKS